MQTPFSRHWLRGGAALACLTTVGTAQAGVIGGVIDYAPLAIAGVPTLGEWALVLVALLVGAFGYRALRGRVGGRLMSNLMIVGAAAAAGFAGNGIVREAVAQTAFDVNMSSATGGTITGVGWTRLTNTSGVALRILDIRPSRGIEVQSPPPASPECTIGGTVPVGAQCNVLFANAPV